MSPNGVKSFTKFSEPKPFDLLLNKGTALPHPGEKAALQFRVEAFNLFNYSNSAVPSGFRSFAGTLTDISEYSENPLATAGEITTTVGNPRQMQFSLKILF